MAFEFVAWSLIITSALLVMFDSWVLYKACSGTKYKVVLWLMAGLLMSNMFYLVFGIGIF